MEKVLKNEGILQLTHKYMGQWVVLSRDYKKVIAKGETLSEVLRKTPNEKERVVFKVLPGLGYAPICFK